MAKTCNDCRYLLPQAEGAPLCTRFPPVPIFIPGQPLIPPQTISIYPPVNPNNPCGEHRTANMEGLVTPLRSAMEWGQSVQIQRDPGDENEPKAG